MGVSVETIYVDGIPAARLLEANGVKILSIDTFLESRRCLDYEAKRVLELGPHKVRIVELDGLELVVYEVGGRGQVVSVRKRVVGEEVSEEYVKSLLRRVEELCSD